MLARIPLRLTSFTLVVVAMSACQRSTAVNEQLVPESFNVVRPQGVVATATARIESADGASSLIVLVVLQNPGPTSVRLEFLGSSCLVRALLYPDEGLAGKLIWNGMDINCPDIAQALEIGAGQSRSIEHRISVPESVRNESRKRAAFVQAVVELTPSRVLGISAGQLQTNIPES